MNISCRQSSACKSPLFIVGMPRSGTKLLRSLLNQHPKVFMMTGETEFLPYWYKCWDAKWDGLKTRGNFELFYNQTIKLPYFMKRKNEGRLIKKDVWYELCLVYGFSLSGVFEALIRHDAGALTDDSLVWGDKSPSYINHIGLLMELYPDARIIHIVRDVRDYCLSINKAWNKNMIRAAVRWADSVEAAHHNKDIWPENIFEIKFEELLSNPESVVLSVCEFLCLDFDPGMVSLSEPSENIGDAAGQARIVSTNMQKFKSEMGQEILEKIESAAGHILKKMGYSLELSPAHSRPGLLAMAGYGLADKLNLLRKINQEMGFAKSLIYNYRNYYMKQL